MANGVLFAIPIHPNVRGLSHTHPELLRRRYLEWMETFRTQWPAGEMFVGLLPAQWGADRGLAAQMAPSVSFGPPLRMRSNTGSQRQNDQTGMAGIIRTSPDKAGDFSRL